MYIENVIFEHIKNTIAGMKVPGHRQEKNTIENVKWLYANLGKFNKEHPNYNKAMKIIEQALKDFI
jgi:hypothetical protein